MAGFASTPALHLRAIKSFAMRTTSIRAEWEGRLLDGKFPLLEWLGGSDDRGVFLTVLKGIQRSAIKLILAEPSDAVAYLARWDTAKPLTHPNLAPILETGRCEIEGTSLVYVVTEIAERVLSQFIQDRPLKVTEVKDILEPILDSLSYLHEREFVHGHIKPSNILIIGGELKISGDEFLVLPGTKNQLVNPMIYDAPEVTTGAVTAAADIWSLGMTISEALMQRPPIWKRSGNIDPIVPDTLPQPFLRIVQDCLHTDPAQRCTLDEIRSRLASISIAPAATPAAAKPIPSVPEPAPLEPEPDPGPRLRPWQDNSFQSDEPELVAPRRSFREQPAEIAPAPALFSDIEEANLTRNPALPLMIGSIVLLAIVLLLLVQGNVINVKPLWQSVVQTATSAIHSIHPAQAPASPSVQSPATPGSSPSATPPAQAPSSAPPSEPSPDHQSASSPAQPSSDQSAPANSPAAPAQTSPAQAPPAPMTGTSNPPPSRNQATRAHRRAVSESGSLAVPSDGAVASRVLPQLSGTARESMPGPREAVVRVTVSRTGSVEDVSYVSPGPGNYFARIAVHAAEQWKFTPPNPDGRHPQPSVWILRFRFTRGQTEASANQQSR